LGLVLGELMEVNLRRAMIYSQGDWGVLFSSPITISLWVLTVISLVVPVTIRRAARRRRGAELEGE